MCSSTGARSYIKITSVGLTKSVPSTYMFIHSYVAKSVPSTYMFPFPTFFFFKKKQQKPCGLARTSCWRWQKVRRHITIAAIVVESACGRLHKTNTCDLRLFHLMLTCLLFFSLFFEGLCQFRYWRTLSPRWQLSKWTCCTSTRQTFVGLVSSRRFIQT